MVQDIDKLFEEWWENNKLSLRPLYDHPPNKYPGDSIEDIKSICRRVFTIGYNTAKQLSILR